MTHHMRIDIAGAIRNRSFDGFTWPDGKPMPRERVKAEMDRLLRRGHKYLPMGDCDNFDPATP